MTRLRSRGPQRGSVAVLLAGTFLASAPLACAQTAQPTAELPAEGNEIIVTAQKRSETLQNVPISIEALSAKKLEDNHVATFDDYARLLPSVSYQDFAAPGQAAIYFRGITSGSESNGSHAGSQPTSALYIDDIPLTTIAGAIDLHIYDMQRVEALSGPQGTLYGASSLSGTLRLITNKPNPNKFEAGVDLTANTFGKGTNSRGGVLNAFINQPLGQGVALRVSGFYERDGGYISNIPGKRTYTVNDSAGNVVPLTVCNAPGLAGCNFTSNLAQKNFNDVETFGGRAALGIDLDENWTVTPTVIYQNQKNHGAFLYGPLPGHGDALIPAVGDLQVQDYSADYGRDEWTQAALTIHGKLSNWDVTYAGGYFTRHVDLVQDYSDYSVNYQNGGHYYYNNFFTAAGANLNPGQIYHAHDDYTKMSHELRVSSPSSKPFRLTAGAFLQRQTDKIIADYQIPGLAAGRSSGSAVPTCGDDVFCTREYRVDRDYAMFADASYDLTPTLTIAGGIRGFIARNSLVGFSGTSGSGVAGCIAPATNGFGPCIGNNKTADQSGEVHRGNISWKIDPTHMVYFTYSTGYRPGGINRLARVDSYRPDTVTNYEIGAKTSWFDRKLTVNVAVYDEEWSKPQFQVTTPGSNGTLSTYNVGSARVRGGEGNVSVKLGHLVLSANAAYIDAKLTSDVCNIGVSGNPDCTQGFAARKGDRLPIQPRFKGNITARYGFDVGSVKAFVQGDVNHQSGVRSALVDNDASAFGPIAGFYTADFSLGANVGPWNLEFFVTNAFDERGTLSLNAVCIPSSCAQYGRAYPTKPQQFGIRYSQGF
jgi:iron complex outermembrane receptor protein